MQHHRGKPLKIGMLEQGLGSMGWRQEYLLKIMFLLFGISPIDLKLLPPYLVFLFQQTVPKTFSQQKMYDIRKPSSN